MRWRRLFVAGLFVVAFALRLLHLRAGADFLLTESPDVGMDRWLAMRMGEAVAGGDALGGWTADYDSAPAYGYWLGLIYWIGGGRWWPAAGVQALLGAAVVPLASAIGGVFSPAVGLLAAAFAALYGPTIFYETLFVKFSLVPVAVSATLLAAIRARASGSFGSTCLAGTAWAVLVALRGNAACVLPVVVWWAAGAAPSWWRVGRTLAWVLLGSLVVLAPVSVRDMVAAREGRGTSLWGIHFYVAAHPGADGTYAPIDGVREDAIGHVVDARRLAEAAAGRSLSPFAVSWYWFVRGVDAVRADPLRFAALQARKVRLSLAGFEEGSFGDEYAEGEALSWVLRLPLLTFGAICPFALLGCWVALAQRRGELLPAFVLAYVLSLLPFFVTGRYRLPMVVPMLVLAALSFSWLTGAVRRRAWWSLAAALAGMGVLLLGLPGRPQDRWTALVLLPVGSIAAWLIERAVACAPSIRDVAERPQPLDPVA